MAELCSQPPQDFPVKRLEHQSTIASVCNCAWFYFHLTVGFIKIFAYILSHFCDDERTLACLKSSGSWLGNLENEQFLTSLSLTLNHRGPPTQPVMRLAQLTSSP